ncbi:MAG: putative undecaprenyl-phosphate N-acetylgalactosaminyl 1-phosphate transferase [Microgenomates bacterium OLB23]|nr:MAG: putative undecaprenyl-phosphate N-acetylgalactosaminyl 1-phosphate transferase [Microgenomates bacterium OLB23]
MFRGAFYNSYIKRVLDIVLVLIIGVVFLPISLIAAILIKITSKGPILADVPNRVGKDQNTFKMYKFRSMILNAHQLLREDEKFKQLYQQYKNGSYKLKQDPRITPIGRYIRRHSIDEIPQFLNVLKGEMSIVGPRAYYPDELEEQQKNIQKPKNS